MSQQSTQHTSIDELFTKDKFEDEIKQGNITFANCDAIDASNFKQVPKAELFTFIQRYQPFGLASIYAKLITSLNYNKWVMENQDKSKEEKIEALKGALIAIQKLRKTGTYYKIDDRKDYNQEMKSINKAWKVKAFSKGKAIDIPDWLKEEKKPKKN